MAYTKTNWQARQGANLNRFTKSQETSASVVLTPSPENVTVPGTAFTAERMNHIEDGIAAAHDGITDLGASAVKLTGAQTVAGVKTFSSIPVLPSSDPTSNNQAARKAYVDARDAGLQDNIAEEAQARAAADSNLQLALNILSPGGAENLPALLASKAPIASPVFTGTPKVPAKTAAAANDGTLIATEAQVALKANTASPTFTGTPKVPAKTAAAANDGTLIATEAQVALKANLASPVFTGTPKVPSKITAAANDGTLIATEAQVALKANIASPVFTGTPKVPVKTTAAANDGTLIATEAQVALKADVAFGSYPNISVGALLLVSHGYTTGFPVFGYSVTVRVANSLDPSMPYPSSCLATLLGSGTALTGGWVFCGALPNGPCLVRRVS